MENEQCFNWLTSLSTDRILRMLNAHFVNNTGSRDVVVDRANRHFRRFVVDARWTDVDYDTSKQVPFLSGKRRIPKRRIPLGASIANDETFINTNGIEPLVARRSISLPGLGRKLARYRIGSQNLRLLQP